MTRTNHPYTSRQRGAMFGLDARLALIIFAVLSVVMGYMAIGKITSAKRAGLLANIQSIDQATGGMQTDMGVFYPMAFSSTLISGGNLTTTGADLLQGLYDKSVLSTTYQPMWHGPYVNLSSAYIPNSNNTQQMSITAHPADETALCTITDKCYLWLCITNVTDAQFDTINSYLDEQNGQSVETDPDTQGTVLHLGDGSMCVRLHAMRDPNTAN